MKKCEYCGNGMADEVGACPGCGAPQEIIQQTVTPAPPNPLIPLFEFKSFRYNLKVYPNRISIVDSRGNGLVATLFEAHKKTDILIKNITRIKTSGFLKSLQITMNDGTVQEIPLILGKNSEKVRDIVLGLI